MAHIVVFARVSLAAVTPGALLAGIGERLTLLTYLFCPEKEEHSDVVLARLRVTEDRGSPTGFELWSLRYGRPHNAVMRIQRSAMDTPATPSRLSGKDSVAHTTGVYRRLEPRGGKEVDAVLEAVHDVVIITMTKRAARTMAWPVGVGAAAWLAEHGHGVLFAAGAGWFAPTAREVRLLK
jgi:hypothetical protein